MPKTHGLSCLAGYPTHRNMLDRCFNPKNPTYHRYGGRGITVCQRWLSIEDFCIDIGRRPEGKSLDRKNNDGHYSCGRCDECKSNGWPKNVRWATSHQQHRNKSNNVWITIHGERRILADWARVLGHRPPAIKDWLRNGPSVDKILALPDLHGYRYSRLRWFIALRKYFKVDDKVAA